MSVVVIFENGVVSTAWLDLKETWLILDNSKLDK